MRLCLDASVVVSLFSTDGHTILATASISHGAWSALLVSDFAAAASVSAIARRVRMQDLTAGEAGTIFHHFDTWVGAICDRVAITPEDVAQADATSRRLHLSLRVPDAIHPALTDRLGVTIATFDRGMAAAAADLAIPVVLE